jgi:hypothetical protein
MAKARYIPYHTGRDVFADDTGSNKALEETAYIRRFAAKKNFDRNIEKVLDLRRM